MTKVNSQLPAQGLRLLAGVAIMLLGLAVSRPVAAGESGPTLGIVVKHGLLTVDLYEAPLADVLREIGDKSGVRVTVGDEVNTRISEAFSGMPLDEGIRRLARWHSVVELYAMPLGATGAPGLVELRVYGKSLQKDQVHGQMAVARGGDVSTSNSASQGVSGGPSVAQRIQSVRRLAQAQTDASLAGLTQALTADRDPQVRAEAAIALAIVGGEPALAALVNAATDENVAVRLRVVEALGRFQNERARAMLDQMRRADSEPQVRRQATSALAAVSR